MADIATQDFQYNPSQFTSYASCAEFCMGAALFIKDINDILLSPQPDDYSVTDTWRAVLMLEESALDIEKTLETRFRYDNELYQLMKNTWDQGVNDIPDPIKKRLFDKLMVHGQDLKSCAVDMLHKHWFVMCTDIEDNNLIQLASMPRPAHSLVGDNLNSIGFDNFRDYLNFNNLHPYRRLDVFTELCLEYFKELPGKSLLDTFNDADIEAKDKYADILSEMFLRSHVGVTHYMPSDPQKLNDIANAGIPVIQWYESINKEIPFSIKELLPEISVEKDIPDDIETTSSTITMVPPPSPFAGPVSPFMEPEPVPAI